MKASLVIGQILSLDNDGLTWWCNDYPQKVISHSAIRINRSDVLTKQCNIHVYVFIENLAQKLSAL